MATGYTAAIAEGISFPDFAMDCARAFGALITMRDDPTGTPIPERFEPSDYHAEAAEHARSELRDLLRMTPEEREAQAIAEWQSSEASRTRRLGELAELRGKYQAMLDAIRCWSPPSPDHEGLKQFMLDQVEKSIDWDCSDDMYREPTPKKTGEEWFHERRALWEESVARHERDYREEVERVESRNRWVAQLRESLATEAV